MATDTYKGGLSPDTPVISTDFLVIGSGIAGLFTALKAAAHGRVIILTKKTLVESSTGLAQGGIAAAVHEEDSPFLHLEDTLEAGAGLCDIEAVDVLVREGPPRVQELIRAGATFDMKDGSISLAREGAHSKARILHAADATGETIRSALVQSCMDQPGIEIRQNHFLLDLITSEDGSECLGAVTYDEAQGIILYQARAIIIGTGGAGQVYKYTTNPSVATGDGIAACFRAGCEISDMEFIQFHPTALYSTEKQRFLISEAVRGEGARLYDREERPFMEHYHPLRELAPRDVVARAIWNEMSKSGSEYVYLDMRQIPRVTGRFPNIYRNCLERGIDLTREMVPVSPAAHYFMGGIKTDTYGETGIYGLFAGGEAACTGVHGANRLASNSLLEGIVFGQRIVDRADEIMYRNVGRGDTLWQRYRFIENHKNPGEQETIWPAEARSRLQEVMWQHAGIIRHEEGLKTAIREIEALSAGLVQGDSLVEYYESINMLTVARIIVQAALWRQESRGSHYRSDHPDKDNVKWRKHTSFVNC